jgi:hypothetical protein
MESLQDDSDLRRLEIITNRATSEARRSMEAERPCSTGDAADNAPVAELARVPTNAYYALNSGEFSYEW